MADQLYSPEFDDFEPEEPVDSSFGKRKTFPGIYALFSETGECLYVGQSVSVPARLRAHTKKPWWPNVATRRTLELESEEGRLIRETILVLKQKPCHNRAIKLGKRKDDQWYEMQFLRFAGAQNKPKKKGTKPPQKN